MGIIQLIRKARSFKTHEHVTISGSGVISTTSEHYILHSKRAKETVLAVREIMSEKKDTSNA